MCRPPQCYCRGGAMERVFLKRGRAPKWKTSMHDRFHSFQGKANKSDQKRIKANKSEYNLALAKANTTNSLCASKAASTWWCPTRRQSKRKGPPHHTPRVRFRCCLVSSSLPSSTVGGTWYPLAVMAFLPVTIVTAALYSVLCTLPPIPPVPGTKPTPPSSFCLLA